MITIAIQGAEFFAYHGFYPEEQQLGAKFIVDVSVDFIPRASIKKDDLYYSVNYEQIYRIVSQEMKQTRKLIEAVAQNIVDELKREFPFVRAIRVTVKKMNPPLGGKVEFSAATIAV
jgi:dihydroneopterin aldolase